MKLDSHIWLTLLLDDCTGIGPMVLTFAYSQNVNEVKAGQSLCCEIYESTKVQSQKVPNSFMGA